MSGNAHKKPARVHERVSDTAMIKEKRNIFECEIESCVFIYGM